MIVKDCIFCKIANKEMSADIIYQDDEIIGVKDVNPEAPIHLLFIPKKHIEWKDEFSQQDLSLLSNLILTAKKVALEQGIINACKLIFNIGKTGHISHIHLHLLGGWDGEIPMKNV